MMENSAMQTTAKTPALEQINHIDSLDFTYGDIFPNEISGRTDSPLHKKKNRYFKRGFDLVFSTIFILPFLCLLPFIALGIKLCSKGPIFFLQKRTKRNGGVFRCIKFRTMAVTTGAPLPQPLEGEDRVTRTGRFLRKYHFDELPQLLNVWWGDMSLVGPRPHMISDNKKFEGMLEGYAARHTVKPGITGLAQVHGYIGPVVAMDEIRNRVNSDIFYIKNWSATLDIKIICHSFLRIPWHRFQQENQLRKPQRWFLIL